MDSSRSKDQDNRYVVRLERECPNCLKSIVKDYDKETLRMAVGNTLIVECPYCQTKVPH